MHQVSSMGGIFQIQIHHGSLAHVEYIDEFSIVIINHSHAHGGSSPSASFVMCKADMS